MMARPNRQEPRQHSLSYPRKSCPARFLHLALEPNSMCDPIYPLKATLRTFRSRPATLSFRIPLQRPRILCAQPYTSLNAQKKCATRGNSAPGGTSTPSGLEFGWWGQGITKRIFWDVGFVFVGACQFFRSVKEFRKMRRVRRAKYSDQWPMVRRGGQTISNCNNTPLE